MNAEAQGKYDPFILKFAFARGYYDGRTLGKALDLFDDLEAKAEYLSGVEVGVIHSSFFKKSEEKTDD